MAKDKKTKEVAAAVEESTATAVSVAQTDQEVKTEEQQEPNIKEVQTDQVIETEEQQEPNVEEVQTDQEVKTEEQQEPNVEEVQTDQEVKTEEQQEPNVEEVQTDQVIETKDQTEPIIEEADGTEEEVITEVQYFGRTYGFTTTAPERMRINGQIMSKQEILSNPDVIVSMIESKSIFICIK